jgi:hypothetical protein
MSTTAGGTTGSPTGGADEQSRRGSFSSRRVFILAAIGSAVGLGNIWRFPYVAYENGGGAFLLPYLVALLTTGIPFLLLDYALGPPLPRLGPAVVRPAAPRHRGARLVAGRHLLRHRRLLRRRARLGGALHRSSRSTRRGGSDPEASSSGVPPGG